VIQEEMVRNRRALFFLQQPAGLHLPERHLLRRHAGADREVRPNLVAGKTIGMMSLTESGGGSDAEGNMKTFAQARRRCLPHQRPEDVGLDGQRDRCWRADGQDRPQRRRQGRHRLHRASQEVSRLEAQPDPMLGLSKPCAPTCCSSTTSWCRWRTAWARKGEGFKIIMRALQPGRVTVAARRWAWHARCFEEAVRYANERELRGQPIGRFQMIQADIAEMAVAIEASRALVYKAAMLHGQQLPSNRIAAIAKYHASQTAKMCADKAVQIFGGYGLAEEYPVSYCAPMPTVLHRRGLGQRAEDHDRRGRAGLQGCRPPPRQDGAARHPQGRPRQATLRRRHV
jgi:hypothetical protein